MSLTPEQIAEKDFLVSLRGYDKEEVRSFLRSVAKEFGTAIESAAPPAPTASEPVPESAVGSPGVEVPMSSEATTASESYMNRRVPGPDMVVAPPAPAPPLAPAAADGDWASLGEEIAAVLRTAHEQAASLRSDAQTAVASLRQQADNDATETRSAADAHAETSRAEVEQMRAEATDERAKAQDEALSLVSEAQSRVEKIMESSKDRAREAATAEVAHLTAQAAELATARDAAKSQLTDLRAQLDKALATADAPVPNSSS